MLTIYFIFQPNEEHGLGAQAMIDDGLFSKFSIDEVYAMPVHLRQYYLKRLAKEYEHIAKERQKAFDKARSNQKS